MSVTPRRVDGVDISHHQAGSLDLVGAKRRGLRWLYHKATEGDTYTDPNYTRRRAEAAKAGIPFGAYHFARAERGDAAAEARRFLAVAKPKPGDLRPALDLETTEGMSIASLRTWAKTWIDVVTQATGVKPVVYTPFDLGSAVNGCLLWRPRYNNTNTPPTLRWDIWQFSNGTYGVPNSLAGIGRVDLNTMRPGLDLDAMLIPKPKPEPQPRPVARLNLMHASLQFGDTAKEHTQDIGDIFDRAKQRKVAWLTGTESGPGAGNTGAELLRLGAAAGYRMWVPSEGKRSAADGGTTDTWIAVRKDLIDGGWEQGFDAVIPGSRELYRRAGAANVDQYPRWGTKGLTRVAFDNADLGRINIGAAHYLTQARHPNAVVKGVDHWEWNKRLGLHIGEWAKEVGRGSALVFYGGDQNMADQRNDQPQGDTFFGAPLTSLGDELKRWPNTGHGPIDVIATYDPDTRVKAIRWDALDDKEFPQAHDHFLTEGTVEIALLKKG
jgi:lysozyme